VAETLPVTHLDHVTLRVPDPAAAAEFYRRVLGLGEMGRAPSTGAILMSALPRNAGAVPGHELVLYPGAPAGLHHYALGVPDDRALAAAAALLRRRGVAVDGPREFEAIHGPAVRLRDQDGGLVELTVSAPRVPRPAAGVPFDLVKLSHVNAKSPDPARAARWWQDVMDFRLSDYIPETFYWLRCNEEHTVVAFVRAETPGLHHIGFEIVSWEEIKRLLDHFVANDIKVEFGPGRHGPGNTLFVYFLDPWRIRWELLSEVSRIQDEATYQPGVWDAVAGRRAAVNLWGPVPPEAFIRG
jgi:catechol 2,3-dioxygenase-like lactoylglutathione lyase family enzyme